MNLGVRLIEQERQRQIEVAEHDVEGAIRDLVKAGALIAAEIDRLSTALVVGPVLGGPT